jgi:Arc/MetJ-type ribon-helix-helix transcriptional regulator
MILTLPPELEQHVNSLVHQGAYPDAQAVLADALKALIREQERREIGSLMEENGIDGERIEQLLQTAEDSGNYEGMTAQDWVDIEREGLEIVNSRKSR